MIKTANFGCGVDSVAGLLKYGLDSYDEIIFADTADNSGQIKANFLPIVDVYWKGQILKNKNDYMKPHYGGRLFTDFYKKKAVRYHHHHHPPPSPPLSSH